MNGYAWAWLARPANDTCCQASLGTINCRQRNHILGATSGAHNPSNVRTQREGLQEGLAK